MKTTLGRRWLSRFLTLAMCLTLSPAVWADGEEQPRITLTPGTMTLYVNDNGTLSTDNKGTLTASVTGIDDDIDAKDIEWRSSNPAVATVQGGEVTAVAPGEATITASYTYTPAPTNPDESEGGSDSENPGDGAGSDTTTQDDQEPAAPTPVTVEAMCKVKVEKRINSLNVTLGSSEMTLTVGSNAALTIGSVKDSGNENVNAANYEVNWKSSNEQVATVKDGTVTAVSRGTATITAEVTHKTYQEAKGSATCTVTVDPKVEPFTLNPSGPLDIEMGKYQNVTANPTPDDAKVTWKSDKPDVVEVSPTNSLGHTGSLYARKPGECTITATAASGSNSNKTEMKVTVSGLVFEEDTPDTLTVYENETTPLPMVLRYGTAVNGTLHWQSSNPNVAQISGNSVAGRAPGSTTISADVGGNYRISINVSVSADEKTTVGPVKMSGNEILRFSSYLSDFNRQADYDLSHLTGIYVDPSQGTLFYGYTSADEPNEGVAQRESYYYGDKLPSGQKNVKDIVFVPNPTFEGGQVTINYTVVSKTYQNHSGRIIINLDQSDAKDINLSATNLTPARFNGNTFNRLCVQEKGSDLDYVVFTLPAANKGTLYSDFFSVNNYGSIITSGAMIRRADLDSVVFVPASGVTGTVTIYYTARSTSGESYNGKVIININRETVPGGGGPVYNLSRGATQTFDDSDFNRYCGQLGLRTLSHVQFSSLPSSSQGTLYHNYRSTSNTGALVQTGVGYYYNTRNPRLDRVTFVPAENFTGTVRIPFTGWDQDGNRFSGNVEINVQGGGGTGSIRYSCIPGQTVNFTLSDFTRLSRDLTDRTLSYIIFEDLPNRSTQGSLYHSTTRVSSTGTRYNNSSGTYRIDKLSFHAVSGFSGSVDIPFVGYTSATGVTFNGVLTIDASGGGGVDTSISYHTDYSTAVVFSRNDFNEISLDMTGSSISSVKFSIPSTSRGDLYRNYRSDTSKGTRIASSSTSVPSSGLSQVAFVPASGFVGTVYIDYTATATGNAGTITGTIEIEVEQPGAAVVARYSTRTAPVSFRQEDFRRSNATLSTIKFNALPTASQGKLYYQYTSPTQYTRLANTSTSYRYATSGSDLISDLTFVPRAGYTGTVTLPYTGTNSNRTTFSGEVVITVQPTTTSTRFNDLGGYSNEQQAAVEYIYENGITVGISEIQYGPELYITRGDFAVMIYKAFGFAPSGNSWVFNDVPPNAYYAQAVNTLYAKGIVSGVGNGDYAPTSYVSRQDAVCMVQRAMRAVNWGATDGSFSTLAGYSDAAFVAVYAQGAMALAVHQGYLPIEGLTLAPSNSLTRIDMAQILHRVLTY